MIYLRRKGSATIQLNYSLVEGDGKNRNVFRIARVHCQKIQVDDGPVQVNRRYLKKNSSHRRKRQVKKLTLGGSAARLSFDLKLFTYPCHWIEL